MALAGSYTAMLKRLVKNPSHQKKFALIYLGATIFVAIAITLCIQFTLGFGVSVSHPNSHINTGYHGLWPSDSDGLERPRKLDQGLASPLHRAYSTQSTLSPD